MALDYFFCADVSLDASEIIRLWRGICTVTEVCCTDNSGNIESGTLNPGAVGYSLWKTPLRLSQINEFEGVPFCNAMFRLDKETRQVGKLTMVRCVDVMLSMIGRSGQAILQFEDESPCLQLKCGTIALQADFWDEETVRASEFVRIRKSDRV